MNQIPIRPAEPADALGVAQVHVRAWQAAYRGLLPDTYLDALRAEDRARSYTFGDSDPNRPATLVAADETGIHGFVTTGPASDPEAPGAGELMALHVDPALWGHGCGAALMAAARERLAAQRYRQAILWVMEGNARGARFYAGDGWLADGGCRVATIWGVSAPELRLHRELP